MPDRTADVGTQNENLLSRLLYAYYHSAVQTNQACVFCAGNRARVLIYKYIHILLNRQLQYFQQNSIQPVEALFMGNDSAIGFGVCMRGLYGEDHIPNGCTFTLYLEANRALMDADDGLYRHLIM